MVQDWVIGALRQHYGTNDIQCMQHHEQGEPNLAVVTVGGAYDETLYLRRKRNLFTLGLTHYVVFSSVDPRARRAS
jgi:hypothetical protein